MPVDAGLCSTVMDVELRHLRAVAAIGDLGSITAAAVTLHVAQPALSRTLSQLENRLGTRLVDRTTRRLELTAAGRVLWEHAHRILRSVDETFGGVTEADQSNPHQIESFLRNNLDFPPDTFDGVLLWDTLQFMAPALLNAVLERLHLIVRPKSYLLVFFNSEERSKISPVYSFRIQDKVTLRLVQRGTRATAQVFNNRGLEKLFAKFESVKFFLTRESLREVIVRR